MPMLIVRPSFSQFRMTLQQVQGDRMEWLRLPYSHSRVSGNLGRYCVGQDCCRPGISGFPLTRE